MLLYFKKGKVMRSTEKQELKRKISRIGLFLLIVFLPIAVVSVLLSYAKVPQVWNIFVLVILLFILFFLYMLVCNKLDQKKKERMSKKKDPFSD